MTQVHPGREGWEAFRKWDVNRTNESDVFAVGTLGMELGAFEGAVQAAHEARFAEYGGRIAPADAEGRLVGVELPMIVSDAVLLHEYYESVETYVHPDSQALN